MLRCSQWLNIRTKWWAWIGRYTLWVFPHEKSCKTRAGPFSFWVEGVRGGGAKGLDTCQEEIPLCLQLSYKENVVLNISHPKRRIHRRKKIVLTDEYIDNKLGELIRLTPHPHPHPHPILSKLNKKWFFSWFSGAALFPLTQLITSVILVFFFFLRSQSILSGGADNQLIIYDISGGGRRTRSNDME